MWIAVNKKNVIVAVSEHPFSMSGHTVMESKESKDQCFQLIGTKLKKEIPIKDLRVAFICNWNDNCGISTYSKFLVEALIPKVKDLHVFSEEGLSQNDPSYVTRCWRRGKSLKVLTDKLLAWKPDYIIIQHEFGIFPRATFFLPFLQSIEDIPYIVTMHSVYEHLDKTICTSAIKNIVVHTDEGKQVLIKLGNTNKIFVIPHGCVKFDENEKTELWNIFQSPYTIVQFGFGFFYKGVDKMLDAVHYLKKTQPKFKDIFYCYLCSENQHTNLVHARYYDFLVDRINELELHDNVAIIRKFQSEQAIKNYLRTAKIAVFPYVSDPKNMVYGASGAIRVAMACGTPVIASNCHQFDDLKGVVPRPGNYKELAQEIDKVFSDENYRNHIKVRMNSYITANDWDITADRYLDLFPQIRD
jgi:glycosyltransferase involved in cell wall biosynthesis